jgi:hypothetical protein
MRRLSSRVAKLEPHVRANAEQSQLPRMFAVGIGDPLPERIHERDVVVWLTPKAESEDAWIRQCEDLRRQQLPEKEPLYGPSL